MNGAKTGEMKLGWDVFVRLASGVWFMSEVRLEMIRDWLVVD